MSIFYRPGQPWTLPRITAIQETVSEAFDLHISAMITKAKPRHLVYPRQIAMFLCRELTKYSLEEIGRCFGGRDHGTVLHAISSVKDELATRCGFHQELNQIRQLCVDRLGYGIAEARARKTNETVFPT